MIHYAFLVDPTQHSSKFSKKLGIYFTRINDFFKKNNNN